MNNRTILLVDDTKELAELYASILEQKGFHVITAHSAQGLLDCLHTASFTPDLLVIDLKLPDMTGIDILSSLKKSGFDAPAIIMTGHGSISVAVEAMQAGASDFLLKPFTPEKLIESVERAIRFAAGFLTKATMIEGDRRTKEGEDHHPSPPQPLPKSPKYAGFIGLSKELCAVYALIENSAKSTASVFITGETGTGKDVCAQSIHALSPRAQKPFIAINCAAIPHGLLESELFGHVRGAYTGADQNREGAVSLARDGTLFLDEIAEMAPDTQTKLLRFLQNLTYTKIGSGKTETSNVRIVCATNRDPLTEIREGRLRQDLYYRLHVVPIHMPPLRDRPGDIIDLADYFLKLYAREEKKSFRTLSPEAEKIFLKLPWYGNVRELQNTIRSMVVLNDGTTITLPMIPAHLIRLAQISGHTQPPTMPDVSSEAPTPIDPLWKIERGAIERAIAQCGGNIPRAAALLEVSPSTIYRKKMEWDKHGAPHPVGG